MDAHYKIVKANLSNVQEKITKLNRRAAKLGVDPVVLVTGSEEEVVVKTHEITGIRTYRTYVNIYVTGTTPKLNGWKLAAVLTGIDADDGLVTLVSTVPGETVDTRFRTTDPRNCEHCKKSRKRSETFVCINDDGTQKQIGRQCLADFLGGADPHSIAKWAEYLADLDLSDSEESGGGGGNKVDWRVDLDVFLPYVVAAIRVDGWLSRTQARNMNGY